MRGKAFHEPVNGGMFIWLHLAGVDTYALAKRALKSGVAVVPGGVFYPGHDVPGSYLRLNFSHATGHRLNDAVGRLASCVNRC
jgi:DNA-binding transcriptional MocR family regulator